MIIQRIESGPRMSQAVTANGLVWLAGVVAFDGSQDIKGQTRQVLEQIDEYLGRAGSNKARIVSAQIWLRDIEKDYAGMNEVWDAWVAPGSAPARATGESKLARADLLVEIIVTALQGGGW